MKKIGQLLVCILPMAVTLIIQILTLLGCEMYIIISGMVSQGGIIFNPSSLINGHMLMLITMISQIITFIVAILVYVFGFKNKKMNGFKLTFSGKTIPFLLLTFIGAEILTGCFLEFASIIVPDIMNEYSKLMEESGLVEMSALSTIATLILAPISEELVFRGITFRLARNFTKHFWIANFIQALMFGIAHGNIVQGTYAFLLGLLLGYIYKAYNNIVVPMICHLIFNFGGTYLVALIFGTSDEVWLLRLFVTLLAAMALTYAGLYLIKEKEPNYELNYAAFTGRHMGEYKRANTVYVYKSREELPPAGENPDRLSMVPPMPEQLKVVPDVDDNQ